jgi:hypothetical protein
MSGTWGHIKKLIYRGLLLIIPVYILWFLYIQYMPMYYSRPNGIHWYFIKNSLEKNYPFEPVRILFLGESRVNAGIDFNRINDCRSFASGGATSIEMYYVLKKYCAAYPKPNLVFLSISPRFLSETFAFYPYAVAMKFIDRHDFKEIKSRLSKSDTTLGTNPAFKFWLYQLNNLEYYQSDVLYSSVFMSYKDNTKLIEEMLNHRGASPHPGLADSCSELNYETRYQTFKPSPIIDTYFDLLLNFCKERRIDVIFDFMPFNESSLKASNPIFIQEYRSYIRGYAQKYPEFRISDTVYAYPDNCFGDESHLNFKGKERYTKYLLERYFLKRGTLK